MQAPPAEAGFDIFDKRWTVYDRILAGNHLFHKELYAELRTFLRQTFGDSPVDVLDLGCGDCQYLAEQLTQHGKVCQISSFTGVDLAAGALELARKNIKPALEPGTPTDFAHTDMNSYVEATSRRFDLAFASYSVHHLTFDEKEKLVQQLARILKPGGIYFQVDVLRRPDEELSDYHNRFVKHIHADWNYLTSEGKEDIARHARACDLPETFETWRAIAQKHGFTSCSVLDAHPHPDTGCCLVLRK